MDKKRILTIFVFSLILILLGVLPAAAKATKTDYTAHATMCEIYDLGTTWTEGDIEHIRNVKFVQYIYSQETRAVGYQYNVYNTNYNHKTGSGVAWGSFRHEVAGGAWEGTFNSKLDEFGLATEGLAIGKGYGDLDGSLIKAHYSESTDIDLTGVPLDDCPLGIYFPTQVHVEAVILETGSQ